MQFLLQLWPPVSFFVVSAITTFFALVGLYLVRKKYPAEVLRENHEVAAIIFNAFGLFYGVMLAFVVFVTWNGYDDATKNLQMECSEVLDLFHSSTQFPEPLNKNLQQGLRDYVTAVYNDEIPKLAEGKISLESGGAHTTLAPLFYEMDTQSMPNRELYAESLRCLNRLAEYRRLRIFAGNDTVPAAVWLVLLVGSLFTISYTYCFGMKNIKAQYMITATLTATVALILFLIYVLDHPFTGANRISLEPLTEALEIMQKT